MRGVVENPLPRHDVLRVPLVVPTGIEVAVVLRKPGGRDGDAQPMARGEYARREPQIDLVLVGFPRFEE